MRQRSNQTLALGLVIGALALAPLAAHAQPEPGKKAGAEHGQGKGPGPKGEHMQGEHAGPHAGGKQGPAPAALPSSGELTQAADTMAGNCPKAAATREQIGTLAEKRKASLAAMKKAADESRKQQQTATQIQKKLERLVKKPGADTTKDFETARAAQEAAAAALRTFETESQTAIATEEELGRLMTQVDEAAKACAGGELALRNAAMSAKKVSTEATREAGKARGLARMPPPAAQAKAKEVQAKTLEMMKKKNDETRSALETLKNTPPPAAPTPAPAKAK
jgi:hypothetical protein